MIIRKAVEDLLQIVDRLHTEYPKKRFTLDGRLVGDLGEILVEQEYELELYDGLVAHHDAETPDGRKVQIKATMKKALSFPIDHVPDYYLGIKIHNNGEFTEVFNGPGSIAAISVKNRVPTKNGLHMVSLSALQRLNQTVNENDRIARRANKRVNRTTRGTLD